jgi:diguanylate cyclase (GGDEF)-like protein
MALPRPASVLFLTADPQAAEPWRTALVAHGYCVCSQPGSGRVDLLVAIGPLPAGFPCRAASEDGAHDVGRIAIGDASLAADVRLPADVTIREFEQTCRLLAEVVRLRREQAAGARRQRWLARMAHLDPLTGLPNRRAWDERVAEVFRSAPRQADFPVGLALLDLDHLKVVNDTRGHLAGDELLRLTGSALRAALRASDLVARLGGDEFGLLLTGLDPAAAYATVERVRSEMPRRLSEEFASTATVSAGLCVAMPLEATPEEVFAGADLALREAKRLGRNRTISGRLLWECDERRSAAGAELPAGAIRAD